MIKKTRKDPLIILIIKIFPTFSFLFHTSKPSSGFPFYGPWLLVWSQSGVLRSVSIRQQSGGASVSSHHAILSPGLGYCLYDNWAVQTPHLQIWCPGQQDDPSRQEIFHTGARNGDGVRVPHKYWKVVIAVNLKNILTTFIQGLLSSELWVWEKTKKGTEGGISDQKHQQRIPWDRFEWGPKKELFQQQPKVIKLTSYTITLFLMRKKYECY